MKLILALAAGTALGLGAHEIVRDKSGDLIPATLEQQAQAAIEADYPKYNTLQSDSHFEPTGFAGSYLAGYFAQRHHDWERANVYMHKNLQDDSANTALLKRAIMLAIGAGQYDEAFKLAHQLTATEKDEAISQMFLAVEAFQKKDYKGARAILAEMSAGGLSDFFKPLLQGWMQAAEGKLDINGLSKHSIHLSHSILIAQYLGKKDQVENLLAESLALGSFTLSELERAGDIYASIDRPEKAKEIYEQVLKFNPADEDAPAKIKKIEAGEKPDGFKSIQSPQEGVALALYDMGRLFFQENSDDSAHIFAHMALYLNPKDVETHILLAGISGRNERYDEAIAYYTAIRNDPVYGIQAQREIANLLEQSGRTEEAITALGALAADNGDLESLIKIGDIYRRENRLEDAIKAYDKAEATIGKDKIIPLYWHLYYVRGMALERHGDWDRAEKDLLAALDFKPDQPYVLNYLGYAWADQNKNLDKAREMIRKAAALEPDDGYITDSLGWILYKDGHYKDAVAHLEKAVELLPYDPVINDHLGDAYWQVGRKLEAKFQWQRALNHIDPDDSAETALQSPIEGKLANGLPKDPAVQQAINDITEDAQGEAN